jgi:hypothetical protein
MKENYRKSSVKPKKKHGFRKKPYSHRKRLHKRKPGGGGTKSRTVRAKLKRRMRLRAAKR